MGVVNMVNNLASKCPRCMFLLRLLTLNGLQFNRRVSVCYVKSADNILSDALSRLQFKRFWKEDPNMNPHPDEVHPLMKSAKRLFRQISPYNFSGKCGRRRNQDVASSNITSSSGSLSTREIEEIVEKL